MSVYVSSLVWKCEELSGPAELMVMLALADWADDKGSNIYPSMETLAQKSRQCKRNLRYILKDLEARGFISIEENRGRNKTNRYQVNMQRLQVLTAPENMQPEAENMQNRTGKHAKSDTKTCKAFAPNTSVSVREPLEYPLVAHAEEKPAIRRPVKSSDEHECLIEQWENSRPLEERKLSTVTYQERQKLKQYLQQYRYEECSLAIEWCGEQGWRITLSQLEERLRAGPHKGKPSEFVKSNQIRPKQPSGLSHLQQVQLDPDYMPTTDIAKLYPAK
jgi:hypothetical protein